jgi:signal transduction histidine kinase
MSAQSYTMNTYNDNHADILTGIGIQAMIAVDNAQLFTTAQQELAERRRVQEELELKNADLERYAYTLSHELKTPLVTIRNFLGLVEEDALTGEIARLRGDLAHIELATEDMQQLIGGLLKLLTSGRPEGAFLPISMHELVHEAVDRLSKRRVLEHIEINAARNMPVVYGDRQHLCDVWENLIDNAAKFIGAQERPRIDIGTRSDTESSSTEESIFYIRDNGIGVKARYQERIFNLFEQLDSSSEGIGIGLTIVKRIVENHGGRIWVESEGLGYGTTFCFTLPHAE